MLEHEQCSAGPTSASDTNEGAPAVAAVESLPSAAAAAVSAAVPPH